MSEAPAQSRLPAGKVVAGRYRVEEPIGEGAQSIVYRAADVNGGGRVALKVIHRHLSGNPQVAKRFHREAKILRQLEGEHIVRLLDFFEEDGLLMIALEHVTGSSLEALLAEKKAPLDLDVAIEIVLQVSAALGVAHARGVVHRDLKPANVLIERTPGDGGARGLRVKVVDFGLGKVLQGELMSTGLTEQGMIFGTPEYMAPEIASGETVDGRADLYAAGVMLYEMAVGEVPFQARTAVGTMTAHLSQAPPSPRKARPDAGITPSIEAVILRALAKSPADRFASARELAEAVAAARDEPLVIAPHAGADAAGIGEIDTDLHLERQALGQARTLRADEVAAISAAEQEAGVAAPRPVTVRPPDPPAPADPPPSTDDSPTMSTGLVPSRQGYLWAIVAVVAALVGVAVGVIVGMR